MTPTQETTAIREQFGRIGLNFTNPYRVDEYPTQSLDKVPGTEFKRGDTVRVKRRRCPESRPIYFEEFSGEITQISLTGIVWLGEKCVFADEIVEAA